MATKPGELPALTADAALFLDFDGTLAAIMPNPDDVRISSALQIALAWQQRISSGALAIVTGRTIKDLDRMLAPQRLTAAGMHGCEMRLCDDEVFYHPNLPMNSCAKLARVAVELRRMSARHDGLRLEEKPLALALHFRAAPQLAEYCRAAARSAASTVSGFDVRLGKMVVEIVPAAVNKGSAIEHFMATAPFAGRIPLYAGDDDADEFAIDIVQALGGSGIRIVDDLETPTRAHFRVSDRRVVCDWLIQNGERHLAALKAVNEPRGE